MTIGNEYIYARNNNVYKLAIEDFSRLFGEASEQGNKQTVIFQTGLTGSTGYVSSLYPARLSRTKEPQINANPVQQICVYLRSSAVNIFLTELGV